MSARSFKRFRRSVRSWLLRQAVGALSWLPLRVGLHLAWRAGQLGYAFNRRNRALALEHLALAFPELSARERERIARDNFIHLARVTFEAVCIRRIDPQLESYVEFSEEAQRQLKEAAAAGRGYIFATGHMGNWELLARRFARAGMPPAVIAKRTWDPRMDEAVDRFRRKGGVTTLWRDDPSSGRKLLKTMRKGIPLGILIDQDTRVQGVFVPFFGRPAFTPRAAADLALRFRAPLFVGWTRRKPGGRPGYVVEVERVPYDPEDDREEAALRLTAACTARLEQVIRQHPEEWVWMHRRWRTRPAGEGCGPAGVGSGGSANAAGVTSQPA